MLCARGSFAEVAIAERSGKKQWVHWRLQCPKFLRQTFVEWAGETIPHSFWAAAYYRQQPAPDFLQQGVVQLSIQVAKTMFLVVPRLVRYRVFLQLWAEHPS